MADARLATPVRSYTRLNLTAVTTLSTLAPTLQKPTAGIIYDSTASVATEFVPNPSLVTVLPWSSVSNANGPAIRIWGWTSYTQTSGALAWFPRLLLDATLAYPSGTPNIVVDGAALFHFGAITVTASITPAPVVFSPGASLVTPAQVTFDPLGSQMVTVQMKSDTVNQFCGVFWVTV